MERVAGAAELLDGALDDPHALVQNLRDLRRINRWTGGVDLSARAIHALESEGTATRLLDVGTGGADIPVALLAAAHRKGRALTVTAVDSRPQVVDAAARARPGLTDVDGLTLAVADGRALPYPDGTFDVAHASLVVHHLEPEDGIAFLRELRRVATMGIVVNDLARSRVGWLGAVLLTRLLARGAWTRHDGPLSVQRAYTRLEMEDLLRAAGLTVVMSYVGVANHRYAIAAT
jgi:ubiquinone/menaquinone biosynthesis C-methylase UbiE